MLKRLVNKIHKLFFKQDCYYKISYLKNNMDILELMYGKEPYSLNVLITNIDIITSIQSIKFLFKNDFNIKLNVNDILVSNIPYEKITITRWFTNNGKTIHDSKKIFLEWLELVHRLNDFSDNLISKKDHRINNIIFFKENIDDILDVLYNYVVKEL